MAKKKPRAMIGDVSVWCVHDEIVACMALKPNPKNPNTHPTSQIEILGKIIQKQGWRAPITVSKRSGLIVKGHGRLEAALKVGITKAPIDYQDYESEAAEHADMVADNRLAELAETDITKMEVLLSELSDFDIDMELTGFNADDFQKITLKDQKDVNFENEINYEDDLTQIVLYCADIHLEGIKKKIDAIKTEYPGLVVRIKNA
uniref:ParB-like N-terminal domain-containing protein n=1 Tax=viral metagenome TaxID=1070528 RepID=A0A6M3K1W3_9ZZZZ